MQGKGIVKFFFFTLVIVCAYQLSFTWIARNVEKKAENYAETQPGLDTIKDQQRRVDFI